MIKILAIDDNQDNLISIKALIREAFPQTITLTASNGPKGLELAAAEDPDVILLDIVMPGMDGFEVCKKLKADKKLGDIPVVFVTAIKGDKENRIRALECGAEGFLAKPIDESELTAQIRAMLKIKTAVIEKRDEKERLEKLVEIRTISLQKELKERRQAEQALRQSNLFNESLIKTIPFPMDIVDETGTVLFQSDNLKKIFGENALGKKCWYMYRDDKKQCSDCPLIRSITIGETAYLESHGVLNNRIFNISHTGILYQGKKAVLEIFIDITERKHIEQALREKELQYRNLANLGLALIWTSGTDKLCEFFNEPWLKFTGRTLEQELGNGWAEGVHPEDFDHCLESYVASFDKREAF